MSFQYSIARLHRMALLTAHDKCDFVGSRAALQQLADHPDLRPDFGVILDLRATTFVPTTPEVRELVHFMQVVRERFRGRIAVVTSGTAAFGMARMFGSLAGAHDIEVGAFADLHAAIRWLGEPEPSSLAS